MGRVFRRIGVERENVNQCATIVIMSNLRRFTKPVFLNGGVDCATCHGPIEGKGLRVQDIRVSESSRYYHAGQCYGEALAPLGAA